jgi:hypothetical protein
VSETKTYFKAAGGEFLDVENVGSSMLYQVTVENRNNSLRFDANIEVTDCEDLIRWSGYGTAGAAEMTKKIDRAIDVLIRAKEAVARGAAEYAKRKRPKKC